MAGNGYKQAFQRCILIIQDLVFLLVWMNGEMVKMQEKLQALLKGIQEQGAWNLSFISRFFLKDIPQTNGNLLVRVPGRALHRQWSVHQTGSNRHLYKSELKTKFMIIFYLRNKNDGTYFLEFVRGINKNNVERFCELPHKSVLFFF